MNDRFLKAKATFDRPRSHRELVVRPISLTFLLAGRTRAGPAGATVLRGPDGYRSPHNFFLPIDWRVIGIMRFFERGKNLPIDLDSHPSAVFVQRNSGAAAAKDSSGESSGDQFAFYHFVYPCIRQPAVTYTASGAVFMLTPQG